MEAPSCNHKMPLMILHCYNSRNKSYCNFFAYRALGEAHFDICGSNIFEKERTENEFACDAVLQTT